MTAVAVKNIEHRYNGRAVLRDLTFSVPEGLFFIIIGPNGSGKTTLMRLLAGVLPIQNGDVAVFDAPVGRYSRKKLAQHLAYVPQLTPESIPFTVGETVLMGRSPYLGTLGVEGTKDCDIARDAMRFTGVDHLTNRRLTEISGGERQRVFIARAICQAPDILLLDEPTAFLDLAHQIQIMDLLERLKTERRTTVVMVSHDLNLAAMYGDRLLLLKDGGKQGEGPPDQVLEYRALEAAYGCVLLVDQNPLGDFPRVTPVPHRLMKTRNDEAILGRTGAAAGAIPRFPSPEPGG